MTIRTDILVVGAGPAGATVARLLAAGGKQVLLVDAATFPRHKACGGGLPPRTVQALGLDLASVTESVVRTVRLDGGWSGRQTYELPAPVGNAPATCVVDRMVFDQFLLLQARAAGATVMEGCRVEKLSRGPGGLVAHTSQGEIGARIVCACDGVHSTVAKSLGLPPLAAGFCLETHVDMPAGWTDAAKACAIFHVGLIRSGYAWCFPCGQRLSIGVGGSVAGGPGLRAKLHEFARITPELAGVVPGQVRGGFVPEFEEPCRAGLLPDVLFLGDAAGLADPLTGEGIYYAVRSAQLAAAALLAGEAGASYAAAVQAVLVPELRLARHYARRFRAVPAWLRAAGLGLPRARAYAAQFVRVLLGDSSYGEMYAALHRGRAFDPAG